MDDAELRAHFLFCSAGAQSHKPATCGHAKCVHRARYLADADQVLDAWLDRQARPAGTVPLVGPVAT
jgi:hypothetical protein